MITYCIPARAGIGTSTATLLVAASLRSTEWASRDMDTAQELFGREATGEEIESDRIMSKSRSEVLSEDNLIVDMSATALRLMQWTAMAGPTKAHVESWQQIFNIRKTMSPTARILLVVDDSYATIRRSKDIETEAEGLIVITTPGAPLRLLDIEAATGLKAWATVERSTEIRRALDAGTFSLRLEETAKKHVTHTNYSNF